MASLYEGIGAEQIVHEIALALATSLNDHIEIIDARHEATDEEWANAIGVRYKPTITEPVPAENVNKWTIPSFVQTDDKLEKYPGIAVVFSDTTRSPENLQLDQIDVVGNRITIYSFTKASPTEGADICIKRAARTQEAIFRLFSTDPRMRRLIQRNQAFQSATLFEPWAYSPEDTINEGDWWFALSSGQYAVTNQVRTI